MNIPRNNLILRMRKEGATYQQIATAIGVSRERVRQIGTAIAPEWFTNQRQSLGWTETLCTVCGEIMKLRKAKYNRSMSKGHKFYCSRVCLRNRTLKYSSLDERRLAYNAKNRERYKDPEHKRLQNARCIKWYRRIKSDPIKKQEYLKKQRKYLRGYYKRIEEDPEKSRSLRERYRIYSRRNWLKIKSDPDRLREFNRAARENYRKRKSVVVVDLSGETRG